jgi:hypothetical protein
MALSAGTAATIASAASIALPSSTVTSGQSCRAVSSLVDSICLLGLVVGSCRSSPTDKKPKRLEIEKIRLKQSYPFIKIMLEGTPTATRSSSSDHLIERPHPRPQAPPNRGRDP